MYLKVKVKAGEKKETVVKIDEDTYHVSVKEKAERNMANTRVREIIAAERNIPLEAIQIITGHHRSSKILFVRD